MTRRLPVCLFRAIASLFIAAMVFDGPPRAVASDAPLKSERMSPTDANHPWNRLRQRLHIRLESEVGPGLDKLEFDPDDLWALFDYLSDPEWSNPLQHPPERKRYPAERRELQRRLSQAIERLALTSEQIPGLPDNLARVIAAAKYPAAPDANNPSAAFLPADLWDPKGPWVVVREWANNPLAIRHVSFFGGRSSFAVLLRLPGGRSETVAYLKKLREWKPDNPRSIPPQVPPQTQFGLIRRMMVINDVGEIVPTPVTEVIQLRVLSGDHEPQRFLEFRIRRSAVVDDTRGALTLIKPDEVDRSDMLELGVSNDREKRRTILASCRNCHSDQGILSMNSYTGAMDNVSRQRGFRSLVESEFKDQEDSTIAWKQRQYSWGLLRGLNTPNFRD